jgi:predicted RNA binding protein YcfA (HicA-like mRNA interferase family)
VRQLPALPARRVIAALERAGFRVVRTKGAHFFLQHPGDRARPTVVPAHRGDLPPGTLRAILRQARLSQEEFLDLL